MQEDTPKPDQPSNASTEPASAANATPRPETAPQPRPAPTTPERPTPIPAEPVTSAGPPPRFLENLRVADQTQTIPAPQPVQPTELMPDQLESVLMPVTLTVGSGFKFGCGFLLALAFASLAIFLVVSVIFFVASLMGLPIPVGLQ